MVVSGVAVAKVKRTAPLEGSTWDLSELGTVQHTSRWGTVARSKGSTLRYYPGCPWEKRAPSRGLRIVAHVWEQRTFRGAGILVLYYAGFVWEGGNGKVMALAEIYYGPDPGPPPIPSGAWKWPTIEETSPQCVLVRLRWPNGRHACRYIFPTATNLCGEPPSSCLTLSPDLDWGPDLERRFAGSRIWRNVYVGRKGWQGQWREVDTWEWPTEAPPPPGEGGGDIVLD